MKKPAKAVKKSAAERAAAKPTFFRGAALRPVPPGESKQKDVRHLDIHEDDQLDEAQMSKWVRQAAALPGWLA
jgi:hypothetical protein